MSFPKLLEVALAGSLRQEPPMGPAAANRSLPAEARLLRGASYEGLRRLAGRPVERAPDNAPVDPANLEVLAQIPPASAVRLLEILDARPDLLREWLQLVVARKLRVSPLSLPDLLDYARASDDFELRELIAQVGGERLAWLARFNPEWQFAAYSDPEQQLARGSPGERATALRRIRRQDPTRGRELLLDLWPSERGDARPRLLAALTFGLSSADEQFLEQAVREPRKEVRDVALRLIRRIPDSRFGQRWAERARQVITFNQSHARFEIHEPGQVDSEWILDGLDTWKPGGVGLTAWILQQTVSLTPPSIWPRAALDAIDHTDWPVPLLTGLGIAAAAYADADWCVELLMRWAAAAARQEQLPLNPKDLFAALDAARAEAFLRRIIELDPGLLRSLVGARAEPWSADLSRFVIHHLPRLFDKQPISIVDFAEEAAGRLDPCVLPDAERVLDAEDAADWAKGLLDRLVHTLDYRAAMRKELDE